MASPIDGAQILAALTSFMAKHKRSLYDVIRKSYQVLEIAGLVGCAQHYESHGCLVRPDNATGSGHFVFKSTTTGDPRKYSWFVVDMPSGRSFEIHANLPVQSGYRSDGGIYVVDVGVVKFGAKIEPMGKRQWMATTDDLVTLAEVKSFPIYPMLLAHFVGIVHEVKPQFLRSRLPYAFKRDSHFQPTLFSTRGFSGTSDRIIKSYGARGIRVGIVGDLDLRISRGDLDRTDRSICE